MMEMMTSSEAAALGHSAGAAADETASYVKQDLSDIAVAIHEFGLGGSSMYVTGSTGLIGSMLVRGVFRYNHLYPALPVKVYASCRNVDRAKKLFSDEAENLTIVAGDLTAEACLPEKCDYVVHLACPTASEYLSAKPVEVISAIVDGTRAVLEASRLCGAKSVVCASSMEAFGQVYGDELSREEDLGYVDLRSARSCYPEGKRLAELLCYSYFVEYGVPVKVARLAQSFGAGVPATEGRVFAQFARSAIAGEDIVLHTEGKSVGNYCYLADAVRGLLCVLAKGEPGETFTVANEEMTMPIAEMANLVAREVSDGKSRVVFDVPEGNKFGYAADTLLRLDATRLRALGWAPRYGMVEAYRRMLPSLTGGANA